MMSTGRNAYNATNVRLFDGGLVIKQGDRSSSFGFELLDEHKEPIDLSGGSAIIYLANPRYGKWIKTVEVADGNRVSFVVDDILPPARFNLEIHCGGYVFPSDHSVTLTVVSSGIEYGGEDIAKLKEIETDVIVDKVVTAKKLASQDELAQAKADVLSEVESKHYLTKHQDISHLASKDELAVAKSETLASVEAKGYLTSHQDISGLATKAEVAQADKKVLDTVEAKGYLTSHQDISHLARKDELADLSPYAKKVEVDEAKKSVLQAVDDRHYLTEHQDLSAYAKKSELPAPYNDSPVQDFIAREPQRRLEIESEFQRFLQSSLQNLESKLSRQPDNLLSSAVLADGVIPAQFRLSAWASTFIDTSNVKKILIPGCRYTFSYEVRLVKESTVRQKYSNDIGFLLYDWTKPGTIAVFKPQADFVLNGPSVKFSQTFVCPELSERTVFLAYTRRYSDGVNVDLDTFEFLNMRLVRVID